MIKNVGGGKRNKIQSSIFLLGVQQTYISGNEFVDSKVVTIDHTVGEPTTQLINNEFNNTPFPKVTETFAKGPSTAIMKGNTSS